MTCLPRFQGLLETAEEDVTIPGMAVNATWLEPPETTDWPKVFISELRTSDLPEEVASIIHNRVDGYYVPERIESLSALSLSDERGIGSHPLWMGKVSAQLMSQVSDPYRLQKHSGPLEPPSFLDSESQLSSLRNSNLHGLLSSGEHQKCQWLVLPLGGES